MTFGRFDPNRRGPSVSGICGVLFLISLAYVVGFLAFRYYVGYTFERDIDAWMHRAQVAADAEDIREYMQHYKAGLESRHLTTGYWAVYFTRPDNSYELHYRSVVRVLERLEYVVKMEKKSVEYQTALDDIRGTLRELPDLVSGYLWVSFWFLQILCWAGGGFAMLAFAGWASKL